MAIILQHQLLSEGTEILHSIKGTILQEELYAEFEEFLAMNIQGEDESDKEEEIIFEKITFNTDHKIKKSLEEPPIDLELKPLPKHLEYAFLEGRSLLPVIISSKLSDKNKENLITILKNHKRAFGWKTLDIPGICPSLCNHKIQLLDDKKPIVKSKEEVFKKEVTKHLDAGIIYPIADSPWVSPIHCVPKKGGITIVTSEKDELVLNRTITGCKNPAQFMT